MKPNQFYITIILSLFLSVSSFAQSIHPCGTDEVHEDYLRNNQNAKDQIESIFEQARIYGRTPRKSGAKYIIPVVFHVIHDQGDSLVRGDENVTVEQIMENLETANNDFSASNFDTSQIREIFKNDVGNAEVEFRLAKKDPQGNCTDGINRIKSDLTYEAYNNVKNLIRWDVNSYLNIWVVQSIDLSGGPGVIAGFANFPWMNANTDGIVIRSDQVRSGDRTLTHEIGHYLGLYHTFQGGCGNNCTNSGDRVCDTPPTAQPNYGCDLNKNTCSNDNPDRPDQLENFMDYSNCQFMFTKGQATVMHSILENQNLRRRFLHNQSNLYETGVIEDPNATPQANFKLSTTEICAGSTVELIDFSCGAEIANYTWRTPGGTISDPNSSNPIITYPTKGTFDITLVVRNDNGSDSILKQDIIKVNSGVGIVGIPYTESFENQDFKSEIFYFEGNEDQSVKWKINTNVGYEGNQSLFLNNNLLDDGDESQFFEIRDLNIASLKNPFLNFKYAFTRGQSGFRDRLNIYGSQDCGNTWLLLETVLGFQLETSEKDDIVQGEFIPNDNEWKEAKVNLSSLNGSEKIFLRFEWIPGGGNNAYLDAFDFTNTSSIREEHMNQFSLELFPNPAKEELNLQFQLDQSTEVKISVIDMLGKKIFSTKTEKLQTGSNSIDFNLNELNIESEGVYILRFQNGNTQIQKRFTVIR